MKQASDAKGKKTPVKVGAKKSTAAKTKTSALAPKRTSKPVPKGWPVSSNFTYPAPCSGVTKNGNTIMDLDSNDSDNIPSSSIPSKNYLTPGNLLQQNCNGSDVFLRKRAVQSTSALCPTVGGGGDNNKGGPTRFLIVFPGRLSLKAPPHASSSSLNNNAATQRTLNDTDNNDQNEEEKNDNNEDKLEKKNNPFAPTHPPHLLGKLTSLSADDGRRMELRIPLPSSSNTASSTTQNGEQSIVMSGRAIPLSGKYMALSFKRTGGSKDSASSGGGGGGGGNNKKKGTGSIICKDVFRSVIVLGDSKVLDDDGKTVSLEESTHVQNKNDEEGEEGRQPQMLHYGGSDRALDGGGKYNDGRKSCVKGGISAPTAASIPRKDSFSSKESDDVSDASDVIADSSDTDEFVPISAKKRKSVGGAKKRSATEASSEEADEEDLTPARKRTPRRSVDSSKISYVEKSSDEDESDSSDDGDDDSDKEDAYKPTKSKSTEKPAAKMSALTPAAKSNKASKSSAKAGSNSKKSNTPALSVDSSEEENDSDDSLFMDYAYKPSRSKVTEKLAGKKQPAAKTNSVNKASGSNRKKSTPALSVDSSEEESDAEELIKQSGLRKSKTTPTNGGSNGTKRQRSSAAKKVNFSPSNDIINLDSDEDEAENDDLHAISVDARKRLSTLSTNQSPFKASPISRGRRKKNSPTKSSMTTKDDDLSLDDDPFSFL